MAPPIYTGTQNNTPNYTHTEGSYVGYTPKPGQLFIGPNDFNASAATAANATLVRDGVGLWRLRIAASTTTVIVADMGLILSQLAFPAQPPQGGGPAIYKQGNSNINIGITITSAQLLYKIGTANLTSATFGISQAVMPADNAATAPTVTTVLAATTLGLVQRANMYNTLFTPANAAIIPLATTLAQIYAELNVVTPSTSTFDLYGAILNVNYSY